VVFIRAAKPAKRRGLRVVSSRSLNGEEDAVIDTLRTEWPADMARAAEYPEMGTLEHMVHNALDRLQGYARENPVAFGLWAFGIGFVLGWKLKPW
jgi:hypothetical protein